MLKAIQILTVLATVTALTPMAAAGTPGAKWFCKGAPDFLADSSNYEISVLAKDGGLELLVEERIIMFGEPAPVTKLVGSEEVAVHESKEFIEFKGKDSELKISKQSKADGDTRAGVMDIISVKFEVTCEPGQVE